jgi:hypothetical protein
VRKKPSVNFLRGACFADANQGFGEFGMLFSTEDRDSFSTWSTQVLDEDAGKGAHELSTFAIMCELNRQALRRKIY